MEKSQDEINWEKVLEEYGAIRNPKVSGSAVFPLSPDMLIEGIGSLESAVIQCNDSYVAFLQDVDQFCMLPEVNSNPDELEYIARYIQDFVKGQKIFGLMAEQVRAGKPVPKDVFATIVVGMESTYAGLSETVREIYHHDIQSMVNKQQKPVSSTVQDNIGDYMNSWMPIAAYLGCALEGTPLELPAGYRIKTYEERFEDMTDQPTPTQKEYETIVKMGELVAHANAWLKRKETGEPVNDVELWHIYKQVNLLTGRTKDFGLESKIRIFFEENH
jgi:hypothetical protein